MSTVSTSGSPENFWPNIKAAILENPTGQPRSQTMKPQCAICWEKLSIATFPEPPGDKLKGQLLFCGHILCKDCLKKNFPVPISRGEERACPTCRASVKCERCERKICKTFSIPTARESSSAVLDVPPTAAEDSSVKPLCPDCSAFGVDQRPGETARSSSSNAQGSSRYGGASARSTTYGQERLDRHGGERSSPSVHLASPDHGGSSRHVPRASRSSRPRDGGWAFPPPEGMCLEESSSSEGEFSAHEDEFAQRRPSRSAHGGRHNTGRSSIRDSDGRRGEAREDGQASSGAYTQQRRGDMSSSSLFPGGSQYGGSQYGQSPSGNYPSSQCGRDGCSSSQYGRDVGGDSSSLFPSSRHGRDGYSGSQYGRDGGMESRLASGSQYGRDAGRNSSSLFPSGSQYERDGYSGSQYGGRDDGSHYSGSQYGRNAGMEGSSLFPGGSPYGRDGGRDNHSSLFPSSQHGRDNYSGSQYGQSPGGNYPSSQYERDGYSGSQYGRNAGMESSSRLASGMMPPSPYDQAGGYSGSYGGGESLFPAGSSSRYPGGESRRRRH